MCRTRADPLSYARRSALTPCPLQPGSVTVMAWGSARHLAVAVAACSLLAVALARRPLQEPSRTPVAMCLAVKDEHADLREWIEHHRSLGVSRIYVFDNNSTEPLIKDVADYVQQELVQYHYLVGKGMAHPQFTVYDRCLKLYRDYHDWMVFIDADEYLVIPDGRSLPEVLEPYSDFGGLAVNWRQIGASGHDKRPTGGVRASYTKCSTESNDNNKHVKTIANLRHVSHSNGAHAFKYQPGYTAVNTRKVVVEGPFSSPPAFDVISIYHYVTRSWEDYQMKMVRGSGARNHKPAAFFDLVNAQCTADCLALLPHANTLPVAAAQPNGSYPDPSLAGPQATQRRVKS